MNEIEWTDDRTNIHLDQMRMITDFLEDMMPCLERLNANTHEINGYLAGRDDKDELREFLLPRYQTVLLDLQRMMASLFNTAAAQKLMLKNLASQEEPT